MQRNLTQDLLVWKNDPKRKPLILQGARQVGKTWLLKEFGSHEFADLAYVRLEDNTAMQSLFAGSLDPQKLITGLSAYLKKPITSDSLIVLDEVQAVPRALTALKYFCEEMPGQAIVVAGSLLGVALHSGISFPVGKVDLLELFPMTFEEFLLAQGYTDMTSFIRSDDYEMITVFSEQLTDLLKQYYFVGGMPEAVLEYSQTKNVSRVRKIQDAILKTYEGDFSKHVFRDVAEKCRQVWQSIPHQLAKENRKFVYGAVKQGARGRDFEAALQFLSDNGLVHRVWRVAKPGIPLEFYKNADAFKLYLNDIGLLGAMTELDASSIIDGNRMFEEFKGVYTEQFVCQELTAECGYHLYYWSAEKSSGEIDFIFQNQGSAYPVEVKASENLKSKSLAAFCQKYDLQTGIRLSLSSYREESWMRNIPLYATGSLALLNRKG